MTIYVENLDRLFRATLGAVLLYFAFLISIELFASPLIKYAVVAVGVIMVARSTLKSCPIDSILGIKTCKEC